MVTRFGNAMNSIDRKLLALSNPPDLRKSAFSVLQQGQGICVRKRVSDALDCKERIEPAFELVVDHNLWILPLGYPGFSVQESGQE